MQNGLTPFVAFLCVILLIPFTPAQARSSFERIQGSGPSAGWLRATCEAEAEQENVDINFEDVDILVFIKFVSEVTGRNFVLDPKVRGNVTVVSPKKIPLDEVYRVFLSVLEVHGYATLRTGSMTKIVPSAEARGKGEYPP
jgi:type II secretory pathway component GspD/PulD (secretin)